MDSVLKIYYPFYFASFKGIAIRSFIKIFMQGQNF